MTQKKLWVMTAILAIVCSACIITCCSSQDDNPAGQTAEYILKAPDYSDPTMWVTEDGDAQGTGADVFYVVSPPYKDLINVGDIHSCEPWLYSECLAKNIAVRAAAWRKNN